MNNSTRIDYDFAIELFNIISATPLTWNYFDRISWLLESLAEFVTYVAYSIFEQSAYYIPKFSILEHALFDVVWAAH